MNLDWKELKNNFILEPRNKDLFLKSTQYIEETMYVPWFKKSETQKNIKQELWTKKIDFSNQYY